MPSYLTEIITSADPALRDRSLDAFCREATLGELLAECAELDALRRRGDNLYERVRALFFLYAIHRFHLPVRRNTHLSIPITDGKGSEERLWVNG